MSLHSAFGPLPEHQESHAGPYGVEAPPHWDFVVTVSEVTVAVKVEDKERNDHKPDNGDGEGHGSSDEVRDHKRE